MMLLYLASTRNCKKIHISEVLFPVVLKINGDHKVANVNVMGNLVKNVLYSWQNFELGFNNVI